MLFDAVEKSFKSDSNVKTVLELLLYYNSNEKYGFNYDEVNDVFTVFENKTGGEAYSLDGEVLGIPGKLATLGKIVSSYQKLINEPDNEYDIKERVSIVKNVMGFVPGSSIATAYLEEVVNAYTYVINSFTNWLYDVGKYDINNFKTNGVISVFGKNIFELNKAADITSCIDPAGYVYEVFDDNRVEGATALAYYIPYDPDDNNFWDEPKIENAIFWDADDFNQQNPLITTENGEFKWDTPAGWWQVKIEKEGYETTYSEWMTVPPEQTEVYLNLETKIAPEVISIKEIDNNSIQIEFSNYIDISTITSNTLRIVQNDAEIDVDIIPVDSKFSDIYKKDLAKVFTVKSKDLNKGEYRISISDCKSYNEISVVEYLKTLSKSCFHSYEVIVINATCTQYGRKQELCKYCGDVKSEEILNSLGHTLDKGTITTPATCIKEGVKTYKCTGCGTILKTEIIAKTAHNDSNNDGLCDECGTTLGIAQSCTCTCHKSGFSGFIFRFLLIFYKLFGTNKICKCGVSHY